MYFLWIALFGTAMLCVSFLFGGDHDHDHDHDAAHEGEDTMSIFSFKILWMFTVGFGAGGFFAERGGFAVLGASFFGIFAGVVMGGLGFFLMNYLYTHQGNSVIKTSSAVGQFAVVDTAIEPGKIGEVHCTVEGRMAYFQARSDSKKLIPASTRVKVTKTMGNMLVVEADNS
jgi:membrane protein implicated in regulation of membrane protease activity